MLNRRLLCHQASRRAASYAELLPQDYQVFFVMLSPSDACLTVGPHTPPKTPSLLCCIVCYADLSSYQDLGGLFLQQKTKAILAADKRGTLLHRWQAGAERRAMRYMT